MLALIPLLASLAPQLISYLFGAKAGDVAKDVATVVATVVPGADTSTAEGIASISAAIKGDPAKSADLAEKLAQIAADRQAEADRELDAQRAEVMAELKAHLDDTAGARAQTVALAGAHSPLAYGPVVISALVLASFSGVILYAMSHELPAGSTAILNIVIGTLSGMAASVVAYWVGSSVSAGAASTQIVQLAQSAAASVPAAVAQTLAASVPADLAHALVKQAGAAAAAKVS